MKQLELTNKCPLCKSQLGVVTINYNGEEVHADCYAFQFKLTDRDRILLKSYRIEA
jgi:hypothetical protein